MRINYSANKKRREEMQKKKQEAKRNKRLNKSRADQVANPETSPSGTDVVA